MSQTRRLAAILAADVSGYSRLMGADEEGMLERLKALRRELIDWKIAEHHDRIVKTTGDGLLLEFASVIDAARCATGLWRGRKVRHHPLGEPPHRGERFIQRNHVEIDLQRGVLIAAEFLLRAADLGDDLVG
jgi:class 3 adenylate cyclase